MSTIETLQFNMVTLKLQLPEGVFSALKMKSRNVGLYLKQQTALNQYRGGELSFGQAAELAEMNKHEFLEFLSRNNVSMFNYSKEELEEETKEV